MWKLNYARFTEKMVEVVMTEGLMTGAVLALKEEEEKGVAAAAKVGTR